MRHHRWITGLFVLLSVTSAFAWGPRGHRITAIIAERHLSDTAAAQVDALLEGDRLVDVATWADDVRNARPETKEMHFVDIPRSAAAYDASRDCANDDCVIAAIEHFREVLGDTSNSDEDRAEALKFLVHFVGDMHQPLHCADDNDRGGNDVRVKFFGGKSNLHQVWDSRILDRAKIPDDEDYADRLEATLAPGDETQITKGDPVKWANATHTLAVNNAYVLPANKTLGQTYVNKNLPVVNRQLLRGGLRLAKILNDTLH